MTTKLPVPLSIFEQHIIALGKTRSGKSSKMRVMIEAQLDRHVPVCVIDPKGDWWGLKSSADGKKAGYPVVIFGGAHGDVPINAQSGKAVAELVATGNRPCIIDLKGWTVAARTQFFINFAETFFAKSKGRRILAIDEVHNFAPQTSGRVDPQTGLMLHWANRLASEGSGLGITLMSASQRPQKVHKDFVSSHETLIACRVIHKRDRQAYVDWIEACGDDKSGDEVLATVANMKREEAWVWSPEIGFGPKQITWPLFKTYDSFKPQAAQARRLKGWAAVNLEEVKGNFAAAIEEAKANDPKELHREIAKLKAERDKLAKATAPVAKKEAAGPDLRAAQSTIVALRKALEGAMKFIIEINAKDFFKAGGDGVDKAAVEKAIKGATDQVKLLIEHHLDRRNKNLDALRKQGQQVISRLKALLEQDVTIKLDVRHNEPFTVSPARSPAVTGNGALPRSAPTSPRAPVAKPHSEASGSGDHSITPAKQRILDALAWTESLGNRSTPKDALAFLAGASPSSSSYGNNLGALRSAGLIDYPAPGEVCLTDEGAAIATVPAEAPTHDAIMAKVAAQLPPAQMRIVERLAEAHPSDLGKEELAADVGASPSSSSYGNNLGRLRTFGLITYPTSGRVRASDGLFPERKAA